MHYISALVALTAVGLRSLPRIAKKKAKKKMRAEWYLGECIPPETEIQRLNRERYERARDFMSTTLR